MLTAADENLHRYHSKKLPDQTIFASHLRYKQMPEALQSVLDILPQP
jgi:hypothetical protein